MSALDPSPTGRTRNCPLAGVTRWVYESGMSRRYVALAIVLVIEWTYGLAAPPAPGWREYGLGGATVNCLAVAPDLVCAGTTGSGLFCRDLSSSLQSWRPLGPAGTTVLAVWIDPAQPNILVAAIAPGGPLPGVVYRTLDAGASWQRADAGLSGSIQAVSGVPGSPTVYAHGGSIWRSDDLGGSWATVFDSQAGVSLDLAVTDSNTVWGGGETVIFVGYTVISRDSGATWSQVWDSISGPGARGDNQTSDISTHPELDGTCLTGHEGFVLRTTNHGASFQEVLTAPARFHLGWDGGNPSRAYAGGSPNGGGGFAFVSRDVGQTWTPISGALAPLFVFDLAADASRLGVAYAATEDGVRRFYGGGLPLCVDTRAGIDDLILLGGPCPPSAAPAIGDLVVGHLGALSETSGSIDLGEVECLIDGADISLADIDPPEPLPGEGLFFLARLAGAADYGQSSGGLSRRASRGDCAP